MQTRSSTKRIRTSLPSPGTVCTKCQKAGHTSRECAEAERLIVALRVPPNTLLALARNQPGLSTLPREIRDLIYENLVTTSTPIKVCFDYNTSKIYLRLRESEKGGIAAAFMCHAVTRSSLAVEVYEVFFKNNIFVCGDCEVLEEFIRSRYTDVELRMSKSSKFVDRGRTFVKDGVGEPYQPLHRQTILFDRQPWVRNIGINLHCDNQEPKVAEQLGLVLRLPRLQSIDIWIHGLCNKRGKINTIDQKIGQIAAVCKKIRERIGARLTVRVLKSWLGICVSQSHHWLYENVRVKWQDVSWMWEPPSKETMMKVKTWTPGTHREHMQVLMATGDLTQNFDLRCFVQHWLQDHRELERLAKNKADTKDAVH